MPTSYPVFITAALFLAMILNDLIVHSPEKITKHSLEGLICVALMLILSFKDMELVSWGLLILSLVILIVCYHFASQMSPKVVPANRPPPVSSCPPTDSGPMFSSAIPGSETPSTVSVPASHTMSAIIGAKPPPTFTPITGCEA